MDELLLEGQEGSGQPSSYNVFEPHTNNIISYLLAAGLYQPQWMKWLIHGPLFK